MASTFCSNAIERRTFMEQNLNTAAEQLRQQLIALRNDLKKQEKKRVDPNTLRRKSVVSNNSFEYYDKEDVDLELKKKEFREKKDIRDQKLALLEEAKDCYRESEKYLSLKIFPIHQKNF